MLHTSEEIQSTRPTLSCWFFMCSSPGVPEALATLRRNWMLQLESRFECHICPLSTSVEEMGARVQLVGGGHGKVPGLS
jgi:hypothetical protein